MWALCSMNFLAKFFPMGKTNVLRGKITSFQQQHDESVPEAWERFQDYILECPHHGMESWLLIQTFYHGLGVGYFKRKQKNPQAHGYRCSFHPGVFQSINFPQRT